MKNLIFGLCICLLSLACLSVADVRGCSYCLVSANEDLNTGKCAARADGIGNDCTTTNKGNKCSGWEFAVCPD